ncbi:MAG: SUMF1/EgtB/PvdO family nonheme iron enzyme [Pseudomonadota bacterium]
MSNEAKNITGILARLIRRAHQPVFDALALVPDRLRRSLNFPFLLLSDFVLACLGTLTVVLGMLYYEERSFNQIFTALEKWTIWEANLHFVRDSGDLFGMAVFCIFILAISGAYERHRSTKVLPIKIVLQANFLWVVLLFYYFELIANLMSSFATMSAPEEIVVYAPLYVVVCAYLVISRYVNRYWNRFSEWSGLSLSQAILIFFLVVATPLVGRNLLLNSESTLQVSKDYFGMMRNTVPSFQSDKPCEFDHRYGPEMIVIDPGAYQLSADENREVSEPFAIGQCEITVAEFRYFVEITGYVTEVERNESGQPVVCKSIDLDWLNRTGEGAVVAPPMTVEQGSWRNPGFQQSEQHPATCLTVRDITSYIRWLNNRTGGDYRLPRKSEYEFIQRLIIGESSGRQNSVDPCGLENTADFSLSVAFAQSSNADQSPTVTECDDEYIYSAPVGSKQKNVLDLFDFNGNISELSAHCDENLIDSTLQTDALESGRDGCVAYSIFGNSWATMNYTSAPYGIGMLSPEGDRFSIDSIAGATNLVGFRVARDLFVGTREVDPFTE